MNHGTQAQPKSHGCAPPAGRYILVYDTCPGAEDPKPWFCAEWPVTTDVVTTWTDKTILAADDGGGTVTLLALTPTQDEQMRVDPVPMSPRSGRDAFGYGYGGGTPTVTYRAIIRVALPAERATEFNELGGWEFWDEDDQGHPVSQLWQMMSDDKGGPLRLSWPQVQLWARADLHAARAELSATATER